LGADKYLVVYQGTEGSDEVWREVVEVVDARDVSEEVFAYKFFLRAPDFLSVAVDDGVEVRVTLSSLDTRRRSEEVREKGDVDLIDFVVGGRRLYGGGGDGGRVTERRGWAPNNVFGRRGAGW